MGDVGSAGFRDVHFRHEAGLQELRFRVFRFRVLDHHHHHHLAS